MTDNSDAVKTIARVTTGGKWWTDSWEKRRTEAAGVIRGHLEGDPHLNTFLQFGKEIRRREAE
jgi:hypothetical protein